MEDNIGKHVIEATAYGSAYHRGIILSETAKMYTIRPVAGGYTRRINKSDRDVLLPADADIDKAIRSHGEAWKSFRQEVLNAECVLTEIKLRRADAALEALKAGA